VKGFLGNGKENLSSEQKEFLAQKKAFKISDIEMEILKKAVGIPVYRRTGFPRRQEKYCLMKNHRKMFTVAKI
jgi:hypothetical protein